MTFGAAQHVESRNAFYFPDRVEVVDGALLAWTAADDAAGITHQRGHDLLDAFLALAAASADEMVVFLESYGVPELCQHGLPDRHPDRRRPTSYCDLARLPDGRQLLRVDDLRYASRAFGAAVQLAALLSVRRVPDPGDWVDLYRFVSQPPPTVETWEQGRAAVADWLTYALADTGVRPVASWGRGDYLHVTPEADGLLGTLAILLSREVGQGETYTCDVCQAPIPERKRAPKPGEGVFCSRPACRTEQQRINKARSRANRSTEDR